MQNTRTSRGAVVLGGALWLAAGLIVAAFVGTDLTHHNRATSAPQPMPLAVDGEEDR